MAAPRSAKNRSKPPAPRKARHREAQLGFEALAIEGGLLSPDWLARVAALDASGQSEADYGTPKGLQLRDEIGRYWRIAQAHWSDFVAGRAGAPKPEAARALSERLVLALLRETFGFASLAQVDSVVIAERSYPIGFAALGGRVPVVIAPAGSGLDTPVPVFGDGGRRRSAFGLAQEFLNSADGARWGLASDGLALRILRDNASLTRPSWIEADLSRIFTEERYADFAALWLLAHETRFGRSDRPAPETGECALETWREAGREEGTRAREHLRRGVEEALVALGQGFLAQPENTALRAALQNGTLATTAYFQELLRLVYRLIFLLTVEERGLLHPEGSPEAARLYAEGYSLRRLRERSLRRSAHDRSSDLWEAAKIVFRGVATGEPRLALPALAGIFAPAQTPTLDAAKLENRALLLAVFRLSWLREASGLARVNWRDMGPEELGSVYEGLLELVPHVTQGGRLFAFATGGENKGNARKTSGSYYTPDSLVQVLLDSALEPVVASTLAENPERPIEALLELSVVDPACGSGHFLLAAARRLAGHLARLQANGTPSAAEYRHALRQVVGRCLYGVDVNPMAVELCKVSLWMEAVEPGLPLTFLNAHIRQGNALLGATPELMASGIPDVAWKPVEGDDRKVASALKERNKRSEGGQRALDTLWTKPAAAEVDAVARAVAELEASPDTDVDALARKEERWEDLLDSDSYRHQEFVANAWCAAFVWPKHSGPIQDAAPTNDVWLQIRDREGKSSPLTVKTTEELAEQYRFFHWHLAFPRVFERGGFDVVLGNPPWERTSFEEIPYFSSRHPAIAAATTTAARRQLIAALAQEGDPLYQEYLEARRTNDAQQQLATESGRFPFTAVARSDTYSLFTELAAALVSPTGLVGIIVPTGIATAIPLKEFWSFLFDASRIKSLSDFENGRKDGGRYFPDVDNRKKFCLFTLGGAVRRFAATNFGFFLPEATSSSIAANSFPITADELRRINPITGQPPVVPFRRDLRLLLEIHSRAGSNQGETPGWVGYTSAATGDTWALFDETVNTSTLKGLIEGKLVHQFDHRFATYEDCTQSEVEKGEPRPGGARRADRLFISRPRFYVPRDPAVAFLHRKTGGLSVCPVYRDYTSASNERTLIAALVPDGVPVQPLNGFRGESDPAVAVAIARLNSFVVDYVARLKTPDIHLNVTIFNQLPGSPCLVDDLGPLTPNAGEWILTRSLELVCTDDSMRGFARSCGCLVAPFRWDEERRFAIRCELDAAFFHLYGVDRGDVDYILDTFEGFRYNDVKRFGEYRTKRVILETYDSIAEAARSGEPYVTRLDPPPADPRVAHQPDPESLTDDRAVP